VSTAADNQAIVEKALARWGRLDIFFANAGVPQLPTHIEEQDEAVFDRIFAVNVKGVWLGAKYALAVMKKQKRGGFLITASTAAGVSRGPRADPTPVKVVPLAAESLGVRSMATFVEAGETGILIDPGATLSPSRFNLPPSEEEWEELRRANDRISAYAARASLVFVSHYHEDHF